MRLIALIAFQVLGSDITLGFHAQLRYAFRFFQPLDVLIPPKTARLYFTPFPLLGFPFQSELNVGHL
jgi:hypothetical protein